MDKLYIFLAILSTCNYGFSHFVMREPTLEEMAAKRDEVLANCRKELTVSLEGSRSVLPLSFANEEFKCYLGCLGKELDFITEDNEINWDSVRMVVSAFSQTKSEKVEAIKTVGKCEKTVVAEGDHCEKIYQLFKCLKPKFKKREEPLADISERVFAECSRKFNITNNNTDICAADLTSDKCFYKCIAEGMASDNANNFFWEPSLNFLEEHYDNKILLIYGLLIKKRCENEEDDYEMGSCDAVHKFTKCSIDTYHKYITTLKQAVKAMNERDNLIKQDAPQP